MARYLITHRIQRHIYENVFSGIVFIQELSVKEADAAQLV
jgi:hypothetical protein